MIPAVALLIGIILMLLGFERMSVGTGGHGWFIISIGFCLYSGWELSKELSFPPKM